jgi:hypothetical protein
MPGPAVIKGITTVIGKLFGLIDDVYTSGEERLEARQRVMELQGEAFRVVAELQMAELEAQKSIITAEAKGESWIQRSWRPITMLTFVVVIANNYIVAPYLSYFMGESVVLPVPAGMWTLLTVGIGGYIGGRSLEKVAQNGGVKAILGQDDAE